MSAPMSLARRAGAAAAAVAVLAAAALGGSAASAADGLAAEASPSVTPSASPVPTADAVASPVPEPSAAEGPTDALPVEEPAAQPSEAPVAEAEVTEPEVTEPEVTEAVASDAEPVATEPAPTASALPVEPSPAPKAARLAEPAVASALVEEDDDPRFLGADGCYYTFIAAATQAVISDIEGCTDVVVPSVIEGLSVVTVGLSDPMSDVSTFTSLTLPDSVTVVSRNAFTDATALTSVDLGKGLKHVGADAFRGSAVTSLDIPATVGGTGDRAFAFMDDLTEVVLRGSVLAFQNHTFEGDTALGDVHILDRSPVASFGSSTFNGTSFRLRLLFHDGAMGLDCSGESVTIGGETFTSDCLSDVTFDLGALGTDVRRDLVEGTVIAEGPDVITPPGQRLAGFAPALPYTVGASDVTLVAQFEADIRNAVGEDGCTYTYQLEGTGARVLDITGCADVVVPSSLGGAPVEILGDGDGRVSVAATATSLTVPSTVKVIDARAFQDADELATVNLTDGLTAIEDRAFADADALTSITFPVNLRTIAPRAFEHASALATVDLGLVSSIGTSAFASTALTTLTLPPTLTSTGEQAFAFIPTLTEVTIKGDMTALGNFAFLDDTHLSKVVLHDRADRLGLADQLFSHVPPFEFFVHDGALGLDCDGARAPFSGGVIDPMCLVDVTFDKGPDTFDERWQHVEEGFVIEEGPEAVAPYGTEFVGYDPELPFIVGTEDLVFEAQFGGLTPGDYTPSEDDLTPEAQGGFTIPSSVQAGDLLTLVADPAPTGTPEPEPTGDPEPLALPLALAVAQDEEPPVGDDSEDEPDPNDFMDVVLFSTPVQLDILDAPTEQSFVVRIPADTEPGEHKIAVYTVFGDLFGWQPLTVTAADEPEGSPEDPETPAPGDGDPVGEESPDTETPVSDDDPAGDNDPAGQDDPAGEDGAMGGDTDGGDSGDVEEAAHPVGQVGATSGAADGDASANGLDGLSASGPSDMALPLGMAAALIAAGGMVLIGRRHRA
ncbi:leucine-rich repeat domain-containing protein [Demequina sp. NBRC 110055]|uniref:leucine-rich repeat domain-containing protein n=1 Tax=Demequina sp. NBRC 110055 TaxID=1570344 RepID=UPI00118481F5|nr:leucine-rich repeat domain-containing protein [Demequina sp. NBRC 110055]